MASAAETAVDWADILGWNPGVDDAARLEAADPEAFLTTERDGETVGTVACPLFGEDYAFIGLYIVREDQRGQGIGPPLFDRALARAGVRVVGLDAVLDQVDAYADRGFATAHRNERWAGMGGGARPPEVEDVAAGAVMDYDATVFGTPREAFLGAWLPDGALGVRRDGALAGYGALRRAQEGFKIGPLFADDAQTAGLLLAGLRADAGDEPVFLDVPEANPAAVALAQEHLDFPVFQCVRMYRGGPPPEDLARVYGVTSFEFG